MTKPWAVLLPALLLACTSSTPDQARGLGEPARTSTRVDVSGYDASCQLDSDCATVWVEKCSCSCNNHAIASKEQARFDAALAAIECPREDPESRVKCDECPRLVTRCAEGTCVAELPPEPELPYTALDMTGFDLSCERDSECTGVNVHKCSHCGCANTPLRVADQEKFRELRAALECPPPDEATLQIACGGCPGYRSRCADGTCVVEQH